MNCVYAVCIKVDYLLRCISNSRLTHCKRIVAVAVNKTDKTLGKCVLRNLNNSLYLLCVGNGHNAGNYGNINTSL